MNIQILSDLHLEFHSDNGDSFISSMDSTDVDVLVIAGDLGTSTVLPEALRQLTDKFPHVVYVAGNHDYWGSTFDILHDTLGKLNDGISNLHWLNHDVVTIDNQRFVGSCLWFRQSTIDAGQHMVNFTDFHYIGGFVDRVYKENKKAIDFFTHNLKEGDIAITHHLPSFACVAPNWVGSPLNRFFVCDMEEIIKKTKPVLWVHGHTHENCDLVLGQTRLVCNPFGYLACEENQRYAEKLIISA